MAEAYEEGYSKVEYFMASNFGKLALAYAANKMPDKSVFDPDYFEDPVDKFLAKFCSLNTDVQGINNVLANVTENFSTNDVEFLYSLRHVSHQQA